MFGPEASDKIFIDILQDLLKPHDGDFKAYPVSTRVNKPVNDDPGVIERLEY